MISTDDATRAAWTASLRASPVLCHLADDQLRRLIDDGAITRFEAGAELMHAGDRASTVFVVIEGAYDVERSDQTLRLHAPALAGEISALTGTPRTATVRAVEPVTAIAIERERFMRAIGASAAAGQALTELVADRICAPDSIRQVDRFPVEGVIGKGGSGRVLRARHPLLDIPLALKMLSHALALLPDGPDAFIREAGLLVHLDHPGIVRVLDAFEAHGTFFIVMPWIEGGTLRAHLDGAVTFTPEQIVGIADETLDALTTLHAAGLVHRDIKPSNIVVRTSGRVMLIDFGIACPRNVDASHGQLVGSPPYCSPEQILGKPLDGRSDVYSLGCTLYELVFGRPPFGADEVEGVIEGHLHGTPSFDRAPRVPMTDAFVRWLRTCLSRTRLKRPDATAARADLARVLEPTSALRARS